MLAIGRKRLADAGIEDPAADSLALLCAAAGCDRASIIAREREFLTESVCGTFFLFIERRARKEPIQYIVGEWEFMGLPFYLNSDVLIPRPDTECLVESILDAVVAPAPILISISKSTSLPRILSPR